MAFIKNVEELKVLPIADKEMIRVNINHVVIIPRSGAVEGHTGETTYELFVVSKAKKDKMEQIATLDYFEARVGFLHREMRRATFNGKHIVSLK